MYNYLPIGITLAVTLAVIHQLMLRLELLRTGIRTHGLVVKPLRFDGTSRAREALRIRFVDHEGQERFFRPAWARLFPLRAGSTVEVLYLRTDPAQAFVRSFAGLWFPVLMGSTIAVALWIVMFTITG